MLAIALLVYAGIFSGLSLFALVATIVLLLLTIFWLLRRAALALHRYWRFA